jgi:hypothetical protein
VYLLLSIPNSEIIRLLKPRLLSNAKNTHICSSAAKQISLSTFIPLLCSFHQNPDNLIHLPSPSLLSLNIKPNLLPLLPRTPHATGPRTRTRTRTRGSNRHFLLPNPLPFCPPSASNNACLASSSCSLYSASLRSAASHRLFADGVCDAETAVETVEETDEADEVNRAVFRLSGGGYCG